VVKRSRMSTPKPNQSVERQHPAFEFTWLWILRFFNGDQAATPFLLVLSLTSQPLAIISCPH